MFFVRFYKPTKNQEFSKTAQFQFWRNTFVFQVAMLNWPALPLKSGACAVDYYWFVRMRSSCLWHFPSNVRELAEAASNVTGCPTKHNSWWIVQNGFFHYLFSCLIPKSNRYIIWESCYIKIDFKVKYKQAKDLFI